MCLILSCCFAVVCFCCCLFLLLFDIITRDFIKWICRLTYFKAFLEIHPYIHAQLTMNNGECLIVYSVDYKHFIDAKLSTCANRMKEKHTTRKLMIPDKKKILGTKIIMHSPIISSSFIKSPLISNPERFLLPTSRRIPPSPDHSQYI